MDATSGTPKVKAQACATAEKADFSKIDACFNSDQADKLEAAEALFFDTKFPNPVGVPHIEINGEALTDRSYATIIQKLCATGISAGACSSSIVV